VRAGDEVKRPRASLARVMDDLGSTLLSLVHGEHLSGAEVVEVVIYDPYDVDEWPEGSLVLGIGARTSEQVARVLEDAGRSGASGVVFRSPLPDDPTLVELSERLDVPVVQLSPGASWVQVVALLRSVLTRGDVDVVTVDPAAGMVNGDLFAQANAIAELLDAPITIEDRNARVLAFSGRQDEADGSRIDTILGRQVPLANAQNYEARGVFRDLYRSDEPLFILPPEADAGNFTMPRAAIAVRAGGEILGSIWAAVHEPLSPERSAAMVEAAKVVALHLISQRSGADVRRRLVADLVGTALEGGAESAGAQDRLGLGGRSCVVLVLIGVAEAKDSSFADRLAARERMADALSLHLAASRQGSVAALVGDAIYGIVPVGSRARDPERLVASLASEFLRRVSTHGSHVIGVGSASTPGSGLVKSRDGADRAARVLAAGRGGDHHVARIEDVMVQAQLLEMAAMARGRGDLVTGPLARLLDHDQQHGSDLVASLDAWLRSFGDIAAAARTLHVHPNTVRYRLRQIAEIGEFDISDSDSLFAIMLQLRMGSADR
jgi:sugar diacid utilization regulator